VIVTLENVKEIISKRLEMTGDKSIPLLIDAHNVKYWTAESKKYSHSAESIRGASAVAIIHYSFIAEIHINFVKFVYNPPYPFKLFRRRADGLKWLQQFKD
jgi:hypothetical protein